MSLTAKPWDLRGLQTAMINEANSCCVQNVLHYQSHNATLLKKQFAWAHCASCIRTIAISCDLHFKSNWNSKLKIAVIRFIHLNNCNFIASGVITIHCHLKNNHSGKDYFFTSGLSRCPTNGACQATSFTKIPDKHTR